jgi:hypothetical protein
MAKLTTILLVSLWFVMSASQALAYSATDLADMNRAGGCDKKFADGYILGIAESLTQHESLAFPARMTYDKILASVYWYISSNPEVDQEPASVVVENALREAYFKKN